MNQTILDQLKPPEPKKSQVYGVRFSHDRAAFLKALAKEKKLRGIGAVVNAILDIVLEEKP